MAKRRISPLMILPPLIFLGFVGMVIYGMQREDPNLLPSTREGKPTPPLAIEQLGDYPLLTEEMLKAPGVKLVNFWGTWCVACRAEHPTLVWMSKNLDVPLYGIDFDDQSDKALDYLGSKGNPYKALGEARTSQTKIDWGVYGAPETFIIDSNGIILHRYAGPITQRVLKETIMPMIEEAKLR